MMVPAVLLLHVESFSWSEWVLYPDFLIGWLLFFAAYLFAGGPLRHRFEESEPLSAKQVGNFALGMVIMLLALQGPLHELSDYFLFSAHMVQHLLIMLVVPPFLLLGTPGWMIRPIVRLPGVRTAAVFLTRPVVAFLVVNLLFGIWHFPEPYDLMMRDHTVHKGMHLMIMAMGAILWWPVMSPLPEVPRLPGPVQMLYLFILGVPMMAVAVIIGFSDTHFYTWYAQAPRIFPLSEIDDQRLGALIMWVPGALVMWLGITYAYFRWSRPDAAEDEANVRIAPPPQDSVLVGRPGVTKSS